MVSVDAGGVAGGVVGVVVGGVVVGGGVVGGVAAGGGVVLFVWSVFLLHAAAINNTLKDNIIIFFIYSPFVSLGRYD
jgi:hypothetical protein